MATKRQQKIQDEAKSAKASADRAAKDKKYQDSYMAFLDDKEKKEGQSFKNWERAQDRKQKKLKEEEAQTKKQAIEEAKLSKLKAKQITQDKKSRSLARDYSKFLKSNTGTLLEQLKVADADNNLAKMSRNYARDAADEKLADSKQENLASQEAYNIAQEARKEAMLAIESGDFEGVDYVTDLTTQLEQLRAKGHLSDEVFDELTGGAQKFGDSVDGLIESAGGGENFSKKMEMSKDAMASIDGFKDKIFKAKSFLTDPKFRGMMLKGMFIGLAVKAATALGEALKAGFDFAREMGISLSSMPIAVGIAKEEASALLNEFGSLKDVTNENLIAMKWNAYWYGVSASDSAKLLKLQMSITDSTKEMALQDQRDFMKELTDEGLSASKVMADMAGHSEFMAKYMKDGGANIQAAAKYAAKLGMDLGVAEGMADKLLDFESSINAEMEASMLLGRAINLDKARELAFQGKIEEMMKEAKIQAGGEAAFAKMNVVQREALGDAIGLNASQMAEFVKAEDKGNAQAKQAMKDKVMMWSIIGGIALATIFAIGGALWAAISMGAAALPIMGAMTSAAASGAAIGGTIGLGVGMAGGATAAMMMGSGGPVKAGNPLIVGDAGKEELFIPQTDGHILPSVPKMGDGSGATFSAVEGQAIIGELRRSNELNEKRIEQADIHSGKFRRDLDGAFGQRY
jgi:hypothetical protein